MPYPAGPVCLTAQGLYALPCGACTPYRAGPGWGCTPSGPAHPFWGRRRPSTVRVTHTLRSGPGIFFEIIVD